MKKVWINFDFNQLWISCESTFNGLNHFSIICKTSESLILLFESLLYLFQIAGELYTWGKGRYGRLGHGDSEDQTKPKLVEALLGCRVIDVACGKQDYGHIHLQYFPVNINIKLFFPSTSWQNKLKEKVDGKMIIWIHLLFRQLKVSCFRYPKEKIVLWLISVLNNEQSWLNLTEK